MSAQSGDLAKNASQGEHRIARFLRRALRNHPARVTVVVFVLLIVFFWSLLSLPIATASGQRAPVMDALFTAVSAVCVTGLTTVSTAAFWSVFGQIVITAAMFVGGLGVMTLASLLAFAVSRHLGLTQRLIMRESTSTGALSDAAKIILGVIFTSSAVQLVIFLSLFLSFWSDGVSVGTAAWDAVFMAISAFNNAGFVVTPGGIEQYTSDWGVILPITLGAFIGALGFPVVTELRRFWRTPRRWSVHTKLTLSMFCGLVATSIIATIVLEWTNPDTLGSAPWSEKTLGALLSGVSPRSLGISTIAVDDMRPATRLLNDIFMFIGGGSASTAGGIKVTTFAVLILAVLAEARGNNDIEVFRRRLSYNTVRLAVGVLMLSSILVFGSTFALLLLTDFGLDEVLLEAISAFATVGLSTGITPLLPDPAKLLLSLLMLAGRLGPITLATALALRQRHNLIRMPEARPIVG